MSPVIICGVDLSSGFSRAVTVTARFAEQLDCEVALVHVDPEGRMFESVARARQLGELRTLARGYGLALGTRACVREGDAAEELVRAARDLDAEMIVVGSRGRLELGAALLGSVSRQLMESAPCPVVVVPPDAALPAQPGDGSIVCGVEGGERDTALLRFANDLSQRLGTRLHAVHAFNPRPGPVGPAAVVPPLVPELSEAAHARLEKALADSGVDAHASVIALPPAVALERAAEELSAALVVLGAHGDGKLASVLRGSVCIRLAASGPCPVAVLPPGAELAAGSGHYELSAEVA